jgi:hypothetical protein
MQLQCEDTLLINGVGSVMALRTSPTDEVKSLAKLKIAIWKKSIIQHSMYLDS